ncbi:MAG: DNA polymerase I [Devosia sp.]
MESLMHLLLVDGSGYIFRAFHALPQLTRKTDQLPVGCVKGFTEMMWKLMADLKGEDAPTHMAVIFDYSSKTFRDDIYTEYKTHRPPMPEELVPQFPLTRSATRAFSIPSIEMEGWEADDIIATYARQARAAGGRVTIASSDKDLMQLVEPDGSIRLLDTIIRPGQPPLRWIGPDEVFAKFGVTPDKVIEVQALCGDAVDNVPGVPGIGVKTAAELINLYGDVETLLARTAEIKQPKRRQTLEDNRELALISKKLVTLAQNVPVELSLDALVRVPIEAGKLMPFLKAMEFITVAKRLGALLDVNPDDWEADPELSAKPTEPVGFDNAQKAVARKERLEAEGKSGKAAVLHAADEAARIKAMPLEHAAYTTITDEAGLLAMIDEIYVAGRVVIDAETTGLDNQVADLVGIALSTAPGKGAYLPLGHTNGNGMFGAATDGQMDARRALELLKPVLEDRSILKIGHNIKYDMGVFYRYGIAIDPIDDTLLLSYVLDGTRFNTLGELSEHWLGHAGIPIKELIGSGKNQKSFAEVGIPEAARYGAEDSDLTMRLWTLLKPRLVAESMTTLYETEERSLTPVLARMEARGITVDRAILSRLSGDFRQRAAGYEAEAYELAGETFNLGSPKQLGDILFGKMSLPGGTKTKTGQWSTGADVLEELAAQGIPLARKIVDWRQLTKLMGTYTDALPAYINERTKRVHTSYSQASVLTGRLSSNDPNLQNIPVRTGDGRKIRTAFVAPPERVLISADYSQIELRVLAHIADIQALKDAFEEGLDIHAMTASEMFGVPVKDMPSDVRRRAKAINFGIIYGISAFGLANQLGIERSEAGEYIKTYFARFPGIQDYMAEQRRRVKADGFVSTIFGRKIAFPNANSAHPSERSFVERASINAPIQGSAADIIRRAMIRMEPELRRAKIVADMLLQVHDELIFEVDAGTEAAAMPVIQSIMENAAAPAVHLTVPLKVDAHAAHNWDEAH